MENYICPKCGRKTMVKEEEPTGKYVLRCQSCGFKRGILGEDDKRGVV